MGSLLNKIQYICGNPLITQSGIYMLVGVLGPLLSFLFMPIFTRVLSPEDYGMASMFTVLCGLASSFVGLSTHGAMARQYINKEGVDFPLYLSNCIFILLISAGMMSGAVWIFREQIGRYSHFPISWLGLVVLFAAGNHMVQLLKTLFQMQQRPWCFSLISITISFLPVLLSLYLVIGLGMNWQGRVLSRSIATSLLAVGCVIYFYRAGYLRFKVSKAYLNHAFRFGIPLVPHALGMYLISMTDRLLIVNMVGLDDLGIYSVGAQIGMLVGICQGGFAQAWLPVFYKKLKQNSEVVNRKVVKFIYLYDIGLFFVALLGGLLCIPLLKIVLGHRFASAGTYVVWIMVGFAFNGMYKMVSGFLFYTEKTNYLAMITGLTAVSNIVFSYGLIKVNGSVGAAQGTMIAYLMSFICTATVAGRVYKMPWGWRAIK